MLERRDARKEGCKKEGMQEMRGTGKEECRKDGIQEIRNAGKKGYSGDEECNIWFCDFCLWKWHELVCRQFVSSLFCMIVILIKHHIFFYL